MVVGGDQRWLKWWSTGKWTICSEVAQEWWSGWSDVARVVDDNGWSDGNHSCGRWLLATNDDDMLMLKQKI